MCDGACACARVRARVCVLTTTWFFVPLLQEPGAAHYAAPAAADAPAGTGKNKFNHYPNLFIGCTLKFRELGFVVRPLQCLCTVAGEIDNSLQSSFMVLKVWPFHSQFTFF